MNTMFLETLLAAVVGINATELTIQTVRDQTQAVVSEYQVKGLRVQVAKVEVNNPSPLLTRSSPSVCTIMLNTNSTAKVVWGKFVDTKEPAEENALQAFSIAHEMGHCMLSKARKNEIDLPILSAQLKSNTQGQSTEFNTLVGRKSNPGAEERYDETFSDLLGLHYVAKKHPEQFKLVLDKLKAVREEFASHDVSHLSIPFLSGHNLRSVDRFLSQLNGKQTEISGFQAAIKALEQI
jgi:hypothetical protein